MRSSLRSGALAVVGNHENSQAEKVLCVRWWAFGGGRVDSQPSCGADRVSATAATAKISALLSVQAQNPMG